MQYKTELHVHTSEVSPCAHMTASEVADRYIEDGYHSIVVTNHYTDYVLTLGGETWEEQIEHYLSGYRRMKEYAGDRMHVLLGCELCFTENWNDYLIIGVTEEFLRAHPNLQRMTLKTFLPFARENGLLVVQAHPFRNRMTVMPPELLDGVEVFNGSYNQDSRNEIALRWAERYNLIRTSGSDLHNANGFTGGGILTDEPVTDTAQLVSILRSGAYQLYCTGPTARRDGMCDVH